MVAGSVMRVGVVAGVVMKVGVVCWGCYDGWRAGIVMGLGCFGNVMSVGKFGIF